MRIIILTLLVAIALSGWTEVAQTPMPSVIKGTPAKFFLDEKASANYYFRPVSVPSFVTITTEGLVNCDSKTAGSYPV
jgi:hypothetical protein